MILQQTISPSNAIQANSASGEYCLKWDYHLRGLNSYATHRVTITQHLEQL